MLESLILKRKYKWKPLWYEIVTNFRQAKAEMLQFHNKKSKVINQNVMLSQIISMILYSGKPIKSGFVLGFLFLH